MKALIRVTRSTEYCSIVEMDKAEFETLKHHLEYGAKKQRSEARKKLNSLIDVKDWQSDELDDVEEFEPFIMGR